MNNSTQVLAAFREMTANKAISRDELHDLIKDGILAAGKTKKEAFRALKRRVTDAIYRQLLADAKNR